MKKLLLLCCALFVVGTAGAQCTAALSAAQSPSGNNLLNVSFTNNSSYGFPFTGQRKSFNIDFGDITGLTNYQGTSIPDHVYPGPGTYTVGFRIRSYDSATNTTICTDTTTISVTVAYPACGSTIAVSGTGATRTFTAATPAGTSGMSYSWNFGNGNTGSGASVSNTYAATGNYTVTLTATNGTCTYTNTTTVFIYIPPPPLNCATLNANFNTSISGNIATFTNTSNVASGSYQTIANWSFGDGTTATGYNTPPHAYTAPGVYTVKLVMQWKDSLNTTSCKDSITRNVTVVSVPSPTNIISGNVFYDTLLSGYTYFKVYLIKFDSSTNLLSAVDSVTTGSAPTPYFAFGNKPAGNYRLKAVPQNSTLTGSGHIPTYHDSSVYWNTASVINHSGGTTLNKRIYVLHGSVVSGSGFIGGNVAFGANKGAANSVSNLQVYLRDANMRIIQMAITDSMGNYSFSNLPLAPYSVWPEMMNYTTMPRTPLVINATRPSLTDIDFNVDNTKRSIEPRNTLSVSGCNCITEDYLSVSPVPAKGSLTIAWNATANPSVHFTMTSTTGQVVARTPVLNDKSGVHVMSLEGIAPGVYFLHGSGQLAAKVTRIIVQ